MQRTLLPLRHEPLRRVRCCRRRRESRKHRLRVRVQPLRLVQFGDGACCGTADVSKAAHAHEDEGVEPAVPARAGDVGTVDFVLGGAVVAVPFARAAVEFAAQLLGAAVGAGVG